MSGENPIEGRPYLRHIPNLVTVGRAVLAVPCLVFLSVTRAHGFVLASAILFVVSMALDVLDGYLARRWQVESVLGRILDPVLDKVVVCGCLVLCIDVSNRALAPWMVVVILSRELGVSALRGYIESQGIDFKATVWGKMKTAFQCVAITTILFYGGLKDPPVWGKYLMHSLIWLTLAVVVWSGVSYAFRAWRLLSGLPKEAGSTEKAA